MTTARTLGLDRDQSLFEGKQDYFGGAMVFVELHNDPCAKMQGSLLNWDLQSQSTTSPIRQLRRTFPISG
jgi:hypothetical protein